MLISLERRGLSFRDFVTDLKDVADISSITVAELLMGLHRAATETQRIRRQSFVDAVLGSATVLPFDRAAAEIHARIWAELASAGQLIGQHDMIIAATAHSNEHGVITLNVREFERIPGLEVHIPDW